MTRKEERDVFGFNPRKKTCPRRHVAPVGKIGLAQTQLLQDCAELVLGREPQKFGAHASAGSMDEALERLS